MPRGIYQHKRGRIAWNKGISPKQETRQKMSIAKLGDKNPMKRLKNRNHLSKIQKDRKVNCGEKSHFWKGGISFFPYPLGWIETLRDSIRQRDNFTCQECYIHQDELDGFHKKLAVHHIDYDKNNLNPDNLIILCDSCHSKTNINRSYWMNYFKGRI